MSRAKVKHIKYTRKRDGRVGEVVQSTKAQKHEKEQL